MQYPLKYGNLRENLLQFLVLYAIVVSTMHIDHSTTCRNGKTYTRTLLRETYRESGKVKHRTIANLSHCKPEEIEAIRLALKHKNELSALAPESKRLDVKTITSESVTLEQGVSVGAVWLLSEVAKKLGVTAALGNDRQGKLALWQVITRVLDQGSRLSSVRLAKNHAVGEILQLDSFNEDDLYKNLDWLSKNQEAIEKRLFIQRSSTSTSSDIFLYDVTSSYLEGAQNAFAAFGYNRDRKQGKRQIVIGLLCDAEGCPLSIEVFPGNTSDVKTFTSQINKAASRFGAERVTFVGGRGMIKASQIEELGVAGFHYITATTKSQIDTLIKTDVIQMDLFDNTLAEVEGSDQKRYILRRNPVRAEEIASSRKEKLATLVNTASKSTIYLE
ncbi:hypothetical protein CCP2SC5_510019 [Azospirillaceae bacterium]